MLLYSLRWLLEWYAYMIQLSWGYKLRIKDEMWTIVWMYVLNHIDYDLRWWKQWRVYCTYGIDTCA